VTLDVKRLMSTGPPFEISTEAKQRLVNAATVPSMEYGLVRQFRFEVRNKGGELTDTFGEEHYSIAFDTIEAWETGRSAVRITIDDRALWLPPDTVAQLTGRTLTLLRRYEGEKKVGKIQNVLIAV
jgi:hypothetical protein